MLEIREPVSNISRAPAEASAHAAALEISIAQLNAVWPYPTQPPIDKDTGGK